MAISLITILVILVHHSFYHSHLPAHSNGSSLRHLRARSVEQNRRPWKADCSVLVVLYSLLRFLTTLAERALKEIYVSRIQIAGCPSLIWRDTLQSVD